jgi:hypothetical protein
VVFARDPVDPDGDSSDAGASSNSVAAPLRRVRVDPPAGDCAVSG